MEKGSLSDYVKRNSASICLSWKQRLKICLDAALGLQHLHKETDEFPKGIIHRDVKPGNILLGENWVAKVSDFGMFKLSSAGQTNSAMVTNLKGTCGYYAPEYLRSYRITRKIDVYAFGIVLFEVLCRKKPWERGDESYYVGENEDLGLWAQENVDTKIKTEISYDSLNEFTDILGRSLRPDPIKRPTMDDVILALKNALERQEREEEQIRNIRLKATRAPEIDISELESLFSVATASDGPGKGGGRRGSKVNKPEKVQLVNLRRACNCEIMLTKIKIPLPDMLNAVLALDASALDIDQVENFIKFFPKKEEMETLKNYTGDKEMLGKCEQFFMELMKVPRVKSKLRVFSFTITFSSQINDLRHNLTTINDATREVKESAKLSQIMQKILTLGNALNQGTARGSAIGFKLDSLLKLSNIRSRNNKMTLMHYLCKVLAEKMPDLLDFGKDLVHLEAASKIQSKSLAEEMQVVSKGLEKVEQELSASENDGAISAGFQKVLKNFLDTAEAEVRSLISLYSEVGRNADSLSQYFGEDPARCPFEQVTQTLAVFVKMFNKARDENEQQADAEKKKLEKEALKEQAAANSLSKKEGVEVDLKKDMKNIIRNQSLSLKQRESHNTVG